MKKYLLIAIVLGLNAVPAWAVPIPFSDSVVDLVGGVSLLDEQGNGLTDDFSVSAPPVTLPSSDDASVVSSSGSSAFAFAAAEPGFLTTSTEVAMDNLGLDFSASASATAAFSGRFTALTASSRLLLAIDHQATAATAITELIISVTDSLSTRLLSQNFLFAGPDSRFLNRAFSFDLPAGAQGIVELLLISQTDASAGGQSANLATLGFRLQAIPAPSTLASLLVGLIAWTILTRRRFIRTSTLNIPRGG